MQPSVRMTALGWTHMISILGPGLNAHWQARSNVGLALLFNREQRVTYGSIQYSYMYYMSDFANTMSFAQVGYSALCSLFPTTLFAATHYRWGAKKRQYTDPCKAHCGSQPSRRSVRSSWCVLWMADFVIQGVSNVGCRNKVVVLRNRPTTKMR